MTKGLFIDVNTREATTICLYLMLPLISYRLIFDVTPPTWPPGRWTLGGHAAPLLVLSCLAAFAALQQGVVDWSDVPVQDGSWYFGCGPFFWSWVFYD